MGPVQVSSTAATVSVVPWDADLQTWLTMEDDGEHGPNTARAVSPFGRLWEPCDGAADGLKGR